MSQPQEPRRPLRLEDQGSPDPAPDSADSRWLENYPGASASFLNDVIEN